MNNDQISSSHGENYAKHANGDTAKEVVFDETQTEPQHQAPADNAAHANGGPPPIRPPFYRRLTAWWDDPFRPKANFAEKLTVFITLVIAGIGATQACIYRGQLQVMSGQLRQMRQSSADATNQVWQAVGNINWMARSMDWSQKEAQRSIELSEQESRTALNASIANSRLEQRPWLGAATDIGVMDSDKPLPDAMNFGVINYGKTFAKKVTLSQHSTFSATLFTVLPATHETTEKSVAVLAPNAPSIMRTGPLDHTSKLRDIFPFSAITNDWYFYLWGEITYQDVFHPPGTHHTQFCFYRKISVSGGLTQCEMHNEAD